MGAALHDTASKLTKSLARPSTGWLLLVLQRALAAREGGRLVPGAEDLVELLRDADEGGPLRQLLQLTATTEGQGAAGIGRGRVSDEVRC